MSLFAELTASVNAVRPAHAHAQLRPAVGDRGVDLCCFGLLMVYSASIALADGRYASYGRYYFVIRHGAFISAGLLAAAVTLTIPSASGSAWRCRCSCWP